MKINIKPFLLFGFLLGAALATGRDLFFQLTYLMAAVLTLSFAWTWYSIRWLELERFERAPVDEPRIEAPREIGAKGGFEFLLRASPMRRGGLEPGFAGGRQLDHAGAPIRPIADRYQPVALQRATLKAAQAV